jgi:hypothetical protein
MTGFLVAILGGGLSVAQSLAWLQHHFPVDWRWWRQWVEVGGGGGGTYGEETKAMR